jgi:myb proto-oncogene protein
MLARIGLQLPTSSQCRLRWKDALDPSIDRVNERSGKWTAVEDIKLKDIVQTHGDKNWEDIAALVPGRTKIQCSSRWHNILDTNIDPTTARADERSEDEDIKLIAAVQTHGGKNWRAIAALVPGQTEIQCRQRWKDALDTNIDQPSGRTGKWTALEDVKLKDAVQTHGGKDWGAIAALLPGRTKLQCSGRWREALVSNIDPSTALTGKWSEDEDIKLKDAVQTHGGKNWAAIAALVPSRTERQCRNRRNKYMDIICCTVRGKEHGTLSTAPALRQDPPSS